MNKEVSDQEQTKNDLRNLRLNSEDPKNERNLSEIIKFRWEDKKNRFEYRNCSLFESIDNLERDKDVELLNLVIHLQKYSGVKRVTKGNMAVKLFLCSFIGFTLGYLFILRGFFKIAGFFMIGTPLLTFFVVFAPLMVKGDQIDRLRRYMDKKHIRDKMEEMNVWPNINMQKSKGNFEKNL